MGNISITRMSSKGQVVIPLEMRKGIKEGEKLIILESNGKLILKKASKVDENFHEDLEFAERTEKALKKIESGKGIRMDFNKFVKELEKW
jgi:AbrB family looped-hinge helix DNA binding protein